MRSGGEPHQLDPDLDFFGVDESTATSEFFDSCDLSGLEAEKLTQNLVADAERIRKL